MTHYKPVEPIDISDVVTGLCKRFGVEYNDVATMEITPSKVTVVSYQRNAESGRILSFNDGTPAMVTREFPVKT